MADESKVVSSESVKSVEKKPNADQNSTLLAVLQYLREHNLSVGGLLFA
jgi:hypothetical protein